MFTLNCNGRLLSATRPLVMGVINATPDSFYAGSRFSAADAVLEQVRKMIQDGADIVDIGGQSTRPGSTLVSADEELKRIIPVIDAVHRELPGIFISVDTWYAAVAREAVAAGASIINDVSGGSLDKDLWSTVASLRVPYVLMHMKGTPQTMQKDPYYENVTSEVLDFFIRAIPKLHEAGIYDIIADPGFGFGKTITHNFELLRNLSVFNILEKPLLLGVSRKSTVYKTLNTTADQALNGTTVLNTIGLMNGASILRVHDVKEAREAVTLVEAYNTIGNRQQAMGK